MPHCPMIDTTRSNCIICLIQCGYFNSRQWPEESFGCGHRPVASLGMFGLIPCEKLLPMSMKTIFTKAYFKEPNKILFNEDCIHTIGSQPTDQNTSHTSEVRMLNASKHGSCVVQ